MLVATLSIYLNRQIKPGQNFVDRPQYPVTGMGMIPHEIACWLRTKLEEQFPDAYKKPGTSVDCAEEDKGPKVKDKFIEFAALAKKEEFLDLVPPDGLRFDAEYYADSSEDTNDADCLKKVALNGKIGDGQLEDILEKNDLDFSMHLDMQSEN